MLQTLLLYIATINTEFEIKMKCQSYFFIVYVAICEFLGLVSSIFQEILRFLFFQFNYINILIIGRSETIEDCSPFAG